MNNRTQNTNTKAHPVLLGVMCAIISEIIYGFAFIFIKNITSLVNPLYILSWRFIVAWGAFSVLIAAGVIILRETFLPGQIVGVVMIVAGVYIANVRQK